MLSCCCFEPPCDLRSLRSVSLTIKNIPEFSYSSHVSQMNVRKWSSRCRRLFMKWRLSLVNHCKATFNSTWDWFHTITGASYTLLLCIRYHCTIFSDELLCWNTSVCPPVTHAHLISWLTPQHVLSVSVYVNLKSHKFCKPKITGCHMRYPRVI